MWDNAQKDAKYSVVKIKNSDKDEGKDAVIVIDEVKFCVSVNVLRNPENITVESRFNGSKKELEKLIEEGEIDTGEKVHLDVRYFIFFLPEEEQVKDPFGV